jgi:hypothetical protein
MITEALTVIPLLLSVPPTWQPDESRLPATYFSNDASQLHSTYWAFHGTISIIGQPSAPTFLRLEERLDPLTKRDEALRKLAGEIMGYKKLGVDRDDNDDIWNPDRAIEQALSFLEALPVGIPLPKPMLLSEQVGIYWDFGDVYAEIDFDGSGDIDAYGKRPGVPEVNLDRLRIMDMTGQMSFPTQLERIILSPEGAVVA